MQDSAGLDSAGTRQAQDSAGLDPAGTQQGHWQDSARLDSALSQQGPGRPHEHQDSAGLDLKAQAQMARNSGQLLALVIIS